MGAVLFLPLGLTPTLICLYACLLMWLLAGGFRARYQVIKDSPLAWATLVLVVLMLLGASYSDAPVADIRMALSKNFKLLLCLVALSLLDQRIWIERSLNLFTASMLLVLVLSLLSVWISIPGLRVDHVQSSDGQGTSRDYTVFKDHIIQNLMMTLLVLIAALRAIGAVRPRQRLFWSVVVFLAAFDVLFLVHGRTGHLTVIAVLMLVSLVNLTARFRLAALAIIAGLVVSAYAFMPDIRGRVDQAIMALQTIGEQDTSPVGQRFEFYRVTLELIRDRPWLGWGTGSYRTEFCRVVNSAQWCEFGGFHPHNQFLLYGMQIGVIGILAFAGYVCTPLFRSMRLPLRTRTLVWGMTLMLFIDALFNVPHFFANEAHFFILMLATVHAAARLAQSSGSECGV
jgi:O-antigen ligase